MGEYSRELLSHYRREWPSEPVIHGPPCGGRPFVCSPQIAEFRPSQQCPYWTYSTIGMTEPSASDLLEIYLQVQVPSALHVELLAVVAHYHQTGRRLGLGHSVSFGRAFVPGSACASGYLSLPYAYGPSLEWARLSGREVRVLWLVPLHESERRCLVESGVDALESRLEASAFNYLDPMRPAVV